MAKRQLHLTAEEITQLAVAEQQTDDKHARVRYLAIRLYGQSWPMKKIQEVTQAGESTIRQWAMAYRADGLEGLRSKWTGKNANKLSDEQQQLIRERLQQYRPVDLHLSERIYWTVNDLRVAVEKWFGVVYATDTSYQTLFHRSGFSYQRTTQVYRSRPSEAKLAEFEAQLEKKTTDFLQDHPDGQVIALDEMSLYYQATTTRVWSPVGQTPVVRVSPQRDHVHFYGAVNLRNGHEVALPTCEMTSERTAAFLRDLLRCYPTQPILLLWDRASWHKGEAVRQVLAEHPRLETVFFPPASPHLNPQEHVWSQARAAVSHNHSYNSFSQLKQAFLHFLSSSLFPFRWLDKYAPAILFEV